MGCMLTRLCIVCVCVRVCVCVAPPTGTGTAAGPSGAPPAGGSMDTCLGTDGSMDSDVVTFLLGLLAVMLVHLYVSTLPLSLPSRNVY